MSMSSRTFLSQPRRKMEYDFVNDRPLEYNFTEDLLHHLQLCMHEEILTVPAPGGSLDNYLWIMSPEWEIEIRQLTHNGQPLVDLPEPGVPIRLYGIVVDVRPDAGPPHLEDQDFFHHIDPRNGRPVGFGSEAI